MAAVLLFRELSEKVDMASCLTSNCSFNTESIRKLSNFSFQRAKTLYQNNLKHIAFFFTFFNARDRCN